MWQRYARGANAILSVTFHPRYRPHHLLIVLSHRFVVDSADPSLLETAKAELLALIEKPELAGIPLLVLCNKNDLPEALKTEELIEKL